MDKDERRERIATAMLAAIIVNKGANTRADLVESDVERAMIYTHELTEELEWHEDD